jgi:hypothetical protein
MDDPSHEIAFHIEHVDDDEDGGGGVRTAARVVTEDLYCDDDFNETNLVT